MGSTEKKTKKHVSTITIYKVSREESETQNTAPGHQGTRTQVRGRQTEFSFQRCVCAERVMRSVERETTHRFLYISEACQRGCLIALLNGLLQFRQADLNFVRVNRHVLDKLGGQAESLPCQRARV